MQVDIGICQFCNQQAFVKEGVLAKHIRPGVGPRYHGVKVYCIGIGCKPTKIIAHGTVNHAGVFRADVAV